MVLTAAVRSPQPKQVAVCEKGSWRGECMYVLGGLNLVLKMGATRLLLLNALRVVAFDKHPCMHRAG